MTTILTMYKGSSMDAAVAASCIEYQYGDSAITNYICVDTYGFDCNSEIKNAFKYADSIYILDTFPRLDALFLVSKYASKITWIANANNCSIGIKAAPKSANIHITSGSVAAFTWKYIHTANASNMDVVSIEANYSGDMPDIIKYTERLHFALSTNSINPYTPLSDLELFALSYGDFDVEHIAYDIKWEVTKGSVAKRDIVDAHIRTLKLS